MVDLHIKISKYLSSKVNDKQLVLDLTQETMLKALEKSRHQEISNLEAWAIQVAKNLLFDHFRRAGRKALKIQNTIEYNHFVDELLVCQGRYLEQLDEASRELIKEIDLNGTSQKELALKLHIPYPSLKSRIQRARRKLKDMFERDCYMEYDVNGMVTCCYEKTCSTL